MPLSLTSLAERRLLPDAIIRVGIRRLLAQRLRQSNGAETAREFAQQLRQSDLAISTADANEQHYEVPTRFFELALGSRLKYSCGLWPEADMTLDESESAMLALTCERAELADGMRILELGCGWGSLSLWMAEHYPQASILAMSNSRTQREFIESRAKSYHLTNLEVVTANIVDFQPPGKFDRVVSVEMFEHVRNYEQLFARIARWLSPAGTLFAHVFCHRDITYPFEVDTQQSGSSNWMSRHFFAGGVMPSFDLFSEFDRDLELSKRWWLDGTHYARTCEAWLRKLDGNRQVACEALADGENPAELSVQLQRWRMFFMACAELFAYDNGNQWGVGHYLFKKREDAT